MEFILLMVKLEQSLLKCIGSTEEYFDMDFIEEMAGIIKFNATQ